MKQQNLIEEKGLIGEQWVSKQLREMGYLIKNRGQHRLPFDLLAEKNTFKFGIQVKDKEPRIHYPDTGFEKWRYRMYQKWQEDTGKKMLILFTDKSKKIYGNWLDFLGKEEGHGNTWNTKENCEMIYWWIQNLKILKELLE